MPRRKRVPVVSFRPGLDCGKGSARDCFTAVADAPAGFDAAVDVDQEPESFSAVPPAEARASDDPSVLVEPVALVGRGRLAAGGQPSVEASCTDGERDLVERLRGSAGHVECGGSGRPQVLRTANSAWRSTRASAGTRHRSGVASTSHAVLRCCCLRLAPLAPRLERPIGLRLCRELRPSCRVRGATVMPGPDSSRSPERGRECERRQDRSTADAATRGPESSRRSAARAQ
jgi:hypothetical protein